MENKITLEEAIRDIFIPFWKENSPIFFDEAYMKLVKEHGIKD